MTWTLEQMTRRAAAEIRDGDCVNLGPGLPAQVADWIAPDRHVWLHQDDVLSGAGHRCFVDAFTLVHGGHVDLVMVEALEVSEQGDLATGNTPGNMPKGPGSLMDLVVGARRVVVLMNHTSLCGAQKIVSECELPLCGAKVVNRVITELGVIDVTPHGLQLVELAEGVSLSEISNKTGVALNLVVDERPGLR